MTTPVTSPSSGASSWEDRAWVIPAALGTGAVGVSGRSAGIGTGGYWVAVVPSPNELRASGPARATAPNSEASAITATATTANRR